MSGDLKKAQMERLIERGRRLIEELDKEIERRKRSGKRSVRVSKGMKK
jgi:hypothetical protein